MGLSFGKTLSGFEINRIGVGCAKIPVRRIHR